VFDESGAPWRPVLFSAGQSRKARVTKKRACLSFVGNGTDIDATYAAAFLSLRMFCASARQPFVSIDAGENLGTIDSCVISIHPTVQGSHD
jgi:hypothetical protein